MKITWYGQGCFRFIIKEKGKPQVSVFIDPLDPHIKLKAPWKKADILLLTQKGEKVEKVKSKEGGPFLITEPGEYEIKGVFVQGIAAFYKKGSEKEARGTIFTLRVEGMQLCHLGEFSQKELTSEQIEEIGDVDILMVPVGGTPTINGKQALEIISQVEPQIVIPMHYQIPGLKVKRESVDKFLKAFGVESVEKEEALSLTTKDLPKEEETKVLVLKP